MDLRRSGILLKIDTTGSGVREKAVSVKAQVCHCQLDSDEVSMN
jgi:hypothetical protein